MGARSRNRFTSLETGELQLDRSKCEQFRFAYVAASSGRQCPPRDSRAQKEASSFNAGLSRTDEPFGRVTASTTFTRQYGSRDHRDVLRIVMRHFWCAVFVGREARDVRELPGRACISAARQSPAQTTYTYTCKK